MDRSSTLDRPGGGDERRKAAAGTGPYSQLAELYGHSSAVYALEFNCDGSLLASGSKDKTIRVWPHGADRESRELRGHTEPITSLAWDPTAPQRLASSSADKTVRVWDAKAGRIAHSISLQLEALNIVYSHDGKYIAASDRSTVVLIDTRKNRVVRRVVNPYEVYEVQFSRAGLLFVAAAHPSGHGTFEIARIVADKKGTPNLENIQKVVAHAGGCFCLDLHPSGRNLALGGLDSLISIWDLEELYCVRTIVITTASILSVRFNHDGKYLAVSMEDTNLSIVDVQTGDTVVSLTLQKQLDYLCWHPRKNELAYVGDRPSSDKNSNRDGVIKAIVLKEPVM